MDVLVAYLAHPVQEVRQALATGVGEALVDHLEGVEPVHAEVRGRVVPDPHRGGHGLAGVRQARALYSRRLENRCPKVFKKVNMFKKLDL